MFAVLKAASVHLNQSAAVTHNPGKREVSRDKCHGGYVNCIILKESPAFSESTLTCLL
jgi:hypothetical protein